MMIDHDDLGMMVRRLAAFPELELVHARTTRAYPVHVATDVKVALVVDGAKRYDHVGRTHTAARGSLIFADVGEAHAGCPETDRLDVIMLGIGAALFARAIGEDGMPVASRGRFESVVDDAALTRAFVGVCEATLDKGTSALLVGERLETFARTLMRRKPVVHRSFPPSGRTGERAAVERVRDLLHASYADELSLAELADVARLPQPRFLREFRRQIGLPPHAYQIHLRVDRAKLFIARGMPLVEVAAACGFFDQSHLNRHFQRIVGTSPGRYRAACA